MAPRAGNMGKRMDTAFLRRFGLAAVLAIAGAAPAAALDNTVVGDDMRCECMCDLGSDRPVIMGLIYTAPGGNCQALQDRTCNVEDPRQPGLVRSGRLVICDPMIELYQSTVPGGQGGWVADPNGGSQTVNPWAVQPLQGMTYEQQ